MVNTFLPDMMKNNEGHIVSMASLQCYTVLRQLGVYAATKHGIKGKSMFFTIYHFSIELEP